MGACRPCSQGVMLPCPKTDLHHAHRRDADATIVRLHERCIPDEHTSMMESRTTLHEIARVQHQVWMHDHALQPESLLSCPSSFGS